MSLKTLLPKIDRFRELRAGKYELAALVKELNGELKELEMAIVSNMEELDLKAVKATDGTMVSTVVKSFVHVLDKGELYDWLKESGFEDMFTVNTNSLRSFYNERIKNNETVPPGVEQYTETSLSLRKG